MPSSLPNIGKYLAMKKVRSAPVKQVKNQIYLICSEIRHGCVSNIIREKADHHFMYVIYVMCILILQIKPKIMKIIITKACKFGNKFTELKGFAST